MKLLKLYGLFSVMLLLYHAIFHILFLQKAVTPTACFVALRYTIATAAVVLFVPGLVYLAAGRFLTLQKAAFYAAGGIFFLTALLLTGDLVYYRQVGKHVTVEFALAFQNFGDVAGMAAREYLFILILAMLSGGAFLYFWHRWLRRQFFVAQKLRVRTVAAVMFILLSIIALRGGLQNRPLRPADAYQYLSQSEGDFTLNGLYTAFYAVYHAEDFPARGDAESIRLARTLLAAPEDTFIAEDLPFYRSFKPAGKPLKKNVVFLILESWSAKRLGVFGDKSGATPFFDALSRKGWLLTNTFATGRRSIASLPSAVSSIPTLYGSLYITSPYEQNFQRGMGSLFAAEGYSTFFTYAARAGSMGFNAFARLAGFENIVTRESFPSEAAHDGTWGIYDHVMFARAIADIDAAKKPFLSVIYTLHPHPPFTLPAGNEFFRADFPRAKYYNALRYADDTLRVFFAAAEKKTWYKNTVFILMADHAFEDVQGYDAFHIPLLFYAPDAATPGFIPARSDKTVASELDVLPTLIDLLRFRTTHASMGKSLAAPGAHFAFIDVEHAAGIIREKNGALLALIYDAEKYQGYFNMAGDKEWRHRKDEEPFSRREMQSMLSYIGVMGHAISKNRIAPRSSPLPPN